MSDSLEKTGASLQDAFYSGEAGAIRDSMTGDEARARREIAEASGIGDEALLARLTGLGIRAETLAAFTLVPLVEVAWADGRMDRRERDAILHGAEAKGIREDSWSHRLLRIWTYDPPPPGLFEAWNAFVAALGEQLDDGERAAFARRLTGATRAVAEAAGGLLGLRDPVSAEEEAVLERLRASLS